jgi:hypothetical protein
LGDGIVKVAKGYTKMVSQTAEMAPDDMAAIQPWWTTVSDLAANGGDPEHALRLAETADAIEEHHERMVRFCLVAAVTKSPTSPDAGDLVAGVNAANETYMDIAILD